MCGRLPNRGLSLPLLGFPCFQVHDAGVRRPSRPDDGILMEHVDGRLDVLRLVWVPWVGNASVDDGDRAALIYRQSFGDGLEFLKEV